MEISEKQEFINELKEVLIPALEIMIEKEKQHLSKLEQAKKSKHYLRMTKLMLNSLIEMS